MLSKRSKTRFLASRYRKVSNTKCEARKFWGYLKNQNKFDLELETASYQIKFSQFHILTNTLFGVAESDVWHGVSHLRDTKHDEAKSLTQSKRLGFDEFEFIGPQIFNPFPFDNKDFYPVKVENPTVLIHGELDAQDQSEDSDNYCWIDFSEDLSPSFNFGLSDAFYNKLLKELKEAVNPELSFYVNVPCWAPEFLSHHEIILPFPEYHEQNEWDDYPTLKSMEIDLYSYSVKSSL